MSIVDDQACADASKLGTDEIKNEPEKETFLVIEDAKENRGGVKQPTNKGCWSKYLSKIGGCFRSRDSSKTEEDDNFNIEGEEDMPWVAKEGEFLFPETNLNVLKDKLDLGIAFSGGGARSFTASSGAMIALREIKTKSGRSFADCAKYITGISGGAWFSSCYCFYDEDKTGNSIEEYLGPIYPPSELTMEVLSEISPDAGARISPTHGNKELKFDNLGQIVNTLIGADNKKHGLFKRAKNSGWERHFIGPVYHEVAGIHYNAYPVCAENVEKEGVFPFTEKQKEECMSQQRGGFWISGFTVMGPPEFAMFETPFNFTLYETTPLYVGTPSIYKRTFKKDKLETTMELGGCTEPYKFGSMDPARYASVTNKRLIELYKSGVNATGNTTHTDWTITKMAGASSLCPEINEIFIEDIKEPHKSEKDAMNTSNPAKLGTRMGMREKISFKGGKADMIVADGGMTENLGILPLVQRGVKNIVCFCNSPSDIKEDIPITSDLASLWQKTEWVLPAARAECTGYSFYMDTENCISMGSRNMIFNPTEWEDLEKGLRERSESGEATVWRTTHETIRNDYWNIRGGKKINFIWVYLTPAKSFIDELPECTRNALQDKKDTRLKSFPNYDTLYQLEQTPEETNLLANFAYWMVKSNTEVFEQMLEDAENYEVSVSAQIKVIMDDLPIAEVIDEEKVELLIRSEEEDNDDDTE